MLHSGTGPAGSPKIRCGQRALQSTHSLGQRGGDESFVSTEAEEGFGNKDQFTIRINHKLSLWQIPQATQGITVLQMGREEPGWT